MFYGVIEKIKSGTYFLRHGAQLCSTFTMRLCS